MLKKSVCKNFIIFCLLIVPTLLSSAQNSKRGYKLLEKKDYEKAREVFIEVIKEDVHNPAALFGLSLILADDSSSYFDLIGAWEYARVLKSNIEKLTPEEIEFIGEYFYNTETRHISRPVKKKIEYALETIEAKLIKYIREENNLEIVYKVLEKFPDFRHYNNVIHIRNQLEFRKYEKLNQLEGYLEFIQKFPDAAQIDKAVKYRNKMAFDKVCQVNTVEAYKDFLKKYPESSEINDAVKRLNAAAFKKAKQLNTIKAFDDFISEYPDALEVSEAKLFQKQLLFEYAKKIQTMEAYNDFIRKYPDGQQYIDIFNLKSLDNGMRMIAANPLPTNNVQWARSFDEENNEELTASFTVDTANNYLLGGTVFHSDTGSSDAWIIKLTNEGKMVWNIYVGEAYNDEVNLLDVNSKNEILGTGYTRLGSDSSSRESWLFKLGPDGKKLWSKKLGNMKVNSLHLALEGRLFLGGYQLNDSAIRNYSLLVLNDNGKRLWSRTYTGIGEIVSTIECPDQRVLITGTQWRAKIDPRGYLVWESLFSPSDSIVAAQVLARGEICYIGFRNNQKTVFIKTGTDNKPIFDKELNLQDLPLKINTFIRGGQNQLILLVSFASNQVIYWINSLTGEILNSKTLPHGIRVDGLMLDRNNNLMLYGCNKGLMLIRNNGTTF